MDVEGYRPYSGKLDGPGREITDQEHASDMRQADALADMHQRAPLYREGEQLLIDNVAVYPLFQFVNPYALRTWVKGDFAEDARGLFPNDAWASGYIARH